MIISHKYKYVFLCLPRTGTTAIRKELCENYWGQEIHYKHAPFHVFWKNATEEEKSYRVICSLRNPLDRILSLYFKYKSDHDNISKKQIKNVGDKNFIQRSLISLANSILGNRNRYVTSKNPSFEEFFLKFYKLPYSDWHSLYFDRYDFIIRFENIQSDFKQTIEGLGLDFKRPLPVVNKTEKKSVGFEKEFTKSTYPRVERVFFQSMQLYGYDFPKHWNISNPGQINKIQYNLINIIRRIYWEYIR